MKFYISEVISNFLNAKYYVQSFKPNFIGQSFHIVVLFYLYINRIAEICWQIYSLLLTKNNFVVNLILIRLKVSINIYLYAKVESRVAEDGRFFKSSSLCSVYLFLCTLCDLQIITCGMRFKPHSHNCRFLLVTKER